MGSIALRQSDLILSWFFIYIYISYIWTPKGLLWHYKLFSLQDCQFINLSYPEFLYFLQGESLSFDVLLTTYDILLLDEDFLSQVPWSYAIIDEAQRLKNPSSVCLGFFFHIKCNLRYHTWSWYEIEYWLLMQSWCVLKVYWS